MHVEHHPILTIAIPTFNRASYLKLNLSKLAEEVKTIDASHIEIIISDNGSTDGTATVVEDAIENGLNIRYIKNPNDIGSDANIAQCFNEAMGTYVQIMGDDDLYLSGCLSFLLSVLNNSNYGVVCLKSYGYENDYQVECPGGEGKIETYTDIAEYLYKIGPLISFISACIINKSVQQDVDARNFCGTNLVQVNLVIKAILEGSCNIFISKYMLACKRNNSGGYDFSEVFVERIFKILDSFKDQGLSQKAITAFGKKMLIGYYPFNLLRQRLSNAGDIKESYKRFHARFWKSPLFYILVAPILKLPRYPALTWAWVSVFLGRIIAGDLRRGIYFAMNRVRNIIR